MDDKLLNQMAGYKRIYRDEKKGPGKDKWKYSEIDRHIVKTKQVRRQKTDKIEG